MNSTIKTYYPETSLLHVLDARIKIIALVFLTAALFLAHTLIGMLVCLCVLLVFMALSRVPVVAWVPFLPIACVFALMPVVFNGVSFDIYAAQNAATSNESAVFAASWSCVQLAGPIAVWGSFGIVPVGCAYGALLGMRIFILMYASLLFTFTTRANAVVAAIAWFLGPLSRVGVPVRDVSLVFSLALCFIPVIAQEFRIVANAQHCRGACITEGLLPARMKAYVHVFVALLVRLFRRAEILGSALDVRCYGYTAHTAQCETYLSERTSADRQLS